jgi:SAM-dependent methyltransferase
VLAAFFCEVLMVEALRHALPLPQGQQYFRSPRTPRPCLHAFVLAKGREGSGRARPGHQMNGPTDGAFHHRFEDAEKWAKEFDNPERDAWQKLEGILDALHLERTSLVADIGAGTGYFSVRIAKRIPEGKIFAADIEPDMVRYLGERARREHLINLVPVQASADAVSLPEPVDVALVVDTYHHIGNRTQYFAKLKSSLRPAGRLVIVDFKADSPNGPPVRHRISPERVTQELKAAGYTLVDTLEFLPRQYCLVFDKGNS